jgi:predicted transcriptional regulator
MIERDNVTAEDIDNMLQRVRTWPVERQKDAAAMLLMMEEQGVEPYELTEGEEAELKPALEEAERGEFATEEEVEAVFNRYR